MIIYLCNNTFDISWISRTSIYCRNWYNYIVTFLKNCLPLLSDLVSESSCVCCPDNARLQARTIFELVISEKKSTSRVSGNVSRITLPVPENAHLRTRSVCPVSFSNSISNLCICVNVCTNINIAY
jgi:hypothetical protein